MGDGPGGKLKPGMERRSLIPAWPPAKKHPPHRQLKGRTSPGATATSPRHGSDCKWRTWAAALRKEGKSCALARFDRKAQVSAVLPGHPADLAAKSRLLAFKPKKPGRWRGWDLYPCDIGPGGP